MTNQLMHESKYITNHQLEKDKVLQFINKSLNSLVKKPYDVQTQQLLAEKDELGQNVSSHNMLVKNLCIKLHSLALVVTTLKIVIIYV